MNRHAHIVKNLNEKEYILLSVSALKLKIHQQRLQEWDLSKYPSLLSKTICIHQQARGQM